MVNNWSLGLVLGVFSLTGYTRLGSAHTTGLTPSPSPRGEGSEMLCLLHACYLLTCYPLASPTAIIGLTHSHYQPHPQPLPASPTTPLQGERGVICFVYCTLVTSQPVNSLTARPLPNHLVFLLTWHLANYPFVHFSAIILTRRVPFLSTNCSPCRKNSILAEVCFKAKRSLLFMLAK